MDKKFEEAEKQLDKLAHMEKRLEMMYKRIDQLDSTVSALIERVMRQPVITIEVTCPKCGSNVHVSMTGNARLSSKG
jgi:rubrerythrin